MVYQCWLTGCSAGPIEIKPVNMGYFLIPQLLYYQAKTDIEPMLSEGCAIVCDAGTTFTQHWFNIVFSGPITQQTQYMEPMLV